MSLRIQMVAAEKYEPIFGWYGTIRTE